MIKYIFGTNTFIIHQYIRSLKQQYPIDAITEVSGEQLQVSDIPELLRGQSLFSQQRLIILKNATASTIWQALEQSIEQTPDDTNVVIIASAPDKRTKTHKNLLRLAEVVEANDLTEQQATQWIVNTASEQQLTISSANAQRIIQRVGLDQFQLSHALEKLSIIQDASEAAIEDYIDAYPQANAFAVIDAVFTKKATSLARTLSYIRSSEDPYKFFGLLAQHIFYMAAMSEAGDRTTEAIAKDLGAHPYSIKKIQAVVRRTSPQALTAIINELILLDDQLKRTSQAPWVIIEKALYRMMQ